MRPRRLSRRTVLRGLGAAISLPLLDLMSPLGRASAPPLNRLAYLYFPNGIPRGTWHPEEAARDGRLVRLNAWMHPLEPFKDDILIPSNLWTPLGIGHIGGPPTWLTGFDYDSRAVNAGGISADQIAARHSGVDTLLPSLEISLRGEGFFSNSLPRNALSWSAANRPVMREVEPRAVFDRMFRPPSGGATRRSVMDAVLEDARSLATYAGKADQHRLDEYFESIRALEKRDRVLGETVGRARGRPREDRYSGDSRPGDPARPPGIRPSDDGLDGGGIPVRRYTRVYLHARPWPVEPLFQLPVRCSRHLARAYPITRTHPEGPKTTTA